MGGKSQPTTVTQNTAPWGAKQPYLKDIMGQAQGQFAKGSEYAPFQTTVPFSDQTTQALQGIQNTAQSGQGGQLAGNAANSLQTLLGGNPTLQATARGDFVNSNPYLNKQISDTGNYVSDAINSQFSAAGRTGSDAHAGVLAQKLGELSNNYRSQNYQQERQNQLGAAGTIGQQQLGGIAALPGVQDAQYADFSKLGQVGGAYEGQAQNQLQDALSRWNFQQQTPWQNLTNYANIINGAGSGQTGTSTTPSTASGVNQGAGDLAALMGMFSKGFGGGSVSPNPDGTPRGNYVLK